MQPATKMTTAEVDAHLRGHVGDDAILDIRDEVGTHTVTVVPEKLVELVAFLRDDRHLAFNFFDSSFGVDEGEAGFSQIVVLYSTTTQRRILLKVFATGGREKPVLPSLTSLYEGADWMERETWDMFGVEFDGHPGLAPRILSVENFEGWPLRKDFFLASRVAKPWPGVAEPAETDDDGNVIQKETRIGEAPGPMALDELMAAQARAANPRPEAEVGEGESGDDAAEAPAREEVEIDQETYDALIAEGKSERIARSKAKAAFLKKQRKAEAETESAADQEGDA